MLTDEEIKSTARKYALLNALSHGGKADRGSVIGRILAENADLRKEARRIEPIVAEAVQEVNSIDQNAIASLLKQEFPQALEQDIEKKKQVSKADSEKVTTLPDLPDAKIGAVVTRFPPEPNGYMHIGHAKAAIIGSEYAKKYSGKFIVRFDDTNPAAEKKEYYSAFLDSLSFLEIKPDIVRNASDDLPRFYELAQDMFANRSAYVCTCSRETMKEYRASMKECEHRAQDTATNLKLWKQMLEGTLEKKSVTVRYVGDMQSVNTTMRDPVLFRIVEEFHPLKGTQYRVWPTYDFDGPVEDSLDGVTHAMRSKEYELRDELHYSLLRSLDLRVPKIIEFSRLSLQNTTVHKRNLRKLIEEGLIQGWDDPRLPTIAGLRRRGFLPRTIREFILSMGMSKVESEPTWDLLESINRKLLDPIAKRYFFVSNPIKFIVKGAPKLQVRLKNHPEKDMGERLVETNGEFFISGDDAAKLKVGSEVRLIEAYNVKIESMGEEIVAIYDPSGTLEGTLKFQWVAAESKIPFVVLVTGPLLIDEKYNSNSLVTARGVAEKAVGEIAVGEIIQFVRFGFCRIDKPGVAILAHK